MTDNEAVLSYLIDHPDGLTPLVALEECGTLRLAARIFDLRAAGHDIVSEMVEVKARNGKVARVKRYRLVQPRLWRAVA